jgi:Tol biopolymer transport system component
MPAVNGLVIPRSYRCQAMKVAPILGIATVMAALGGGAAASTADWNYDIFVMRSEGSRPTRLTSDPANEMHPVVSPDGRRIVYTRGNADSTDIWIMNADGSGQRPLVASSDIDEDPAWSPDGRWIAFTSITCGANNGPCWAWNVFRIRPDGTGLTRLFADGRNPTWSRDGKRLLVESAIDPNEEADSLVVVRPDGRHTRWVVDGGGCPSWAPDGQRFAYCTYDYERNSSVTWIFDLKTESARRLAMGGFPKWSPMGSSILVHAYEGVFVVAPGRRRRKVARAWANAEWSPKGARIAFSWRNNIYVIGAKGQPRRRVRTFPSELPHVPPVAWSPDGRRLYYTFASHSG